ncbi:MAG: hypothetical protein WC356_04340 [Candidatus Micrarchaeia archaeon]|jgi:hypothetical protein
MTCGIFPTWRQLFETIGAALLVIAGCAVVIACAWLIVVFVLA